MSEIHAAVVAALSDLTGVAKTRTARIPTKDGGSYSYEYANIEDVIDQTRPVLADHGLVALQPLRSSDHGMAVATMLVHESGETLELGELPFRPAGDPQRDGIAITYYRRYALLSALGMAAEDDDGQATRPENAAPPSGSTSEEAFEALREHMTANGIDDPEGDKAKALWKQVKPKADRGRIPDDELKRLLDAVGELDGGEPF